MFCSAGSGLEGGGWVTGWGCGWGCACARIAVTVKLYENGKCGTAGCASAIVVVCLGREVVVRSKHLFALSDWYAFIHECQ